MKKFFTPLLVITFLSIGFITYAQVEITNDSLFITAHQMFLSNELFESGEPFAEELEYDLDELDPEILNLPDSIAYTTGIESYEYSRYLLNTLNGRSGLGLHIMWSPLIIANATKQDSSFDGMFTGGTPNGYKEDDMTMMMIRNFGINAHQQPPANAFPQFADFMKGNPHLPQTVASNFESDYSTTRWDRSKMVKTLNLGGMGQSMLKQYFWAQDMLGSFHDGNDDGIDATGINSPDLEDSPIFDPDNDIYYGGNNVDGFIGQVLTAVSINKTAFLINKLAYDGNSLGAVSPASYNPADGIKFFPTKIGVTESMVLAGLPPKASALEVLDANSQLFDQWSFLLATSNYKNMMNPNNNSDAAHLAYHEVFDGFPFPANAAVTGVPGPFDLMTGASKVIFLNIMAMHFNNEAGTFVNTASLDSSGKVIQETAISAENAAYIIVTLSKFSKEFEGTPLETMANNAILAQANFIINNFKTSNGGFANSFDLVDGRSNDDTSLAAITAIIRGLFAAYSFTDNSEFLDAANDCYNFLINNFYVPAQNAFRTEIENDVAKYNPWNLALLSGALREASLIGKQSAAPLIYTRVFKKVFNKMILSEAESSGETGDDSDGDGIAYIAGGKLPFIFATEGVLDLTTSNIVDINGDVEKISVFPNPTQLSINLDINMKKQAKVLISIFDINGRLVVINKAMRLNKGPQQINIPLKSLMNGAYFMRVSINNQIVAIEKINIQQ